jgi:PaRep2b protein.
MIELERLAYAASLTPFIPAGVEKYSREEVFNILKNDPDPYKKFKEIASDANAGRVKLAEPWESLRVLIMPKRSEEERLLSGRGAKLYIKYRKDENYRRALFYATLALEEVFGVYRSALRKYAEGLREAVQMGEEPFKRDMYVADLEKIKQLTEEESKAFENALSTLRKGLNEYAVRYGLRDLLGVNEDVARRLAEAKQPELSEFSDVNFGVKALAALIAYGEYALGRRGALGTATRYWLEEGGSAWLLYHTPRIAYDRAKKARAERPAAVEEMMAEALRRLFLKPGADHHSDFVKELEKGGELALMFENKTESSYVFRLFRLEEGGGLKGLGISLWIAKVGKGERAGVTYTLIFDVERWRGFFGQKLEVAMKAAEEVGRRLPVEDLFLYMVGWVDSDVAISRMGNKRVLEMFTSHLWQLAETHALFGWSVGGLRITLTLDGPKLQVVVKASLDKLDEAIRKSTKSGWLKVLGVEAESWDGLKRWVADHWNEVINMVKRRLESVKVGPGFDLGKALEELEGLKSKLDDDKIAREVVAPALLLMQAERLGVNETTLKYFGAVVSGAIDGDGYVSAAMRVVDLTSGERVIALLWGAALAAHGIETEVRRVRSVYDVIASGDDAVKLAGLYFLYGSPLLEGDERVINHKLAEAVKLGAGGLDIRWEGLRRRTEGGPVAADLTISDDGAAVKYNVYLRRDEIELQFQSSDHGRVELAARLPRLAGVGAVVEKVGNRDVWYVVATTDRLAAGREELRKALIEIVKEAMKRNAVNASTAERWLEKLEKGRVLMEGWPKYLVRLTSSGALEVRFASTDPDSIEWEAQRLEKMGLKRGVHFTVEMPEGGKAGYVYISKEGLTYAAYLSVRGKDEQQRRLTAKFVELILKRAEKEGNDVLEKAKEIIDEGRSWGSLELKRFEKKVEVNGKTYVVKVKGGEAVEEKQNGKTLLRIKITAEVGRVEGEHIVRVEREYTITYGRYGANNKAMGFAYASANAPGGREADAERLSALVKALTGKEPWIQRMKDGRIMMACGREHLDGFRRYAELADAIENWLERSD